MRSSSHPDGPMSSASGRKTGLSAMWPVFHCRSVHRRFLTRRDRHKRSLTKLAGYLLRGSASIAFTSASPNSSGVSNQGRIESNSLQSGRFYKPMFGAESQSRLAGLIFQLDLQSPPHPRRFSILSTGQIPATPSPTPDQRPSERNIARHSRVIAATGINKS